MPSTALKDPRDIKEYRYAPEDLPTILFTVCGQDRKAPSV